MRWLNKLKVSKNRSKKYKFLRLNEIEILNNCTFNFEHFMFENNLL